MPVAIPLAAGPLPAPSVPAAARGAPADGATDGTGSGAGAEFGALLAGEMGSKADAAQAASHPGASPGTPPGAPRRAGSLATLCMPCLQMDAAPPGDEPGAAAEAAPQADQVGLPAAGDALPIPPLVPPPLPIPSAPPVVGALGLPTAMPAAQAPAAPLPDPEGNAPAPAGVLPATANDPALIVPGGAPAGAAGAQGVTAQAAAPPVASPMASPAGSPAGTPSGLPSGLPPGPSPGPLPGPGPAAPGQASRREALRGGMAASLALPAGEEPDAAATSASLLPERFRPAIVAAPPHAASPDQGTGQRDAGTPPLPGAPDVAASVAPNGGPNMAPTPPPASAADPAAAIVSSVAGADPRSPAPAAAAPQPTAQALPPRMLADAGHQVAWRVARAAEQRIETISVDLRPPELGRVEVRLSFREGAVHQIVVSAERSETFQSFSQDRSQMEQQLQRAGIDLGAGGLELRQGGGGGQQDRHAPTAHRGDPLAGEAEAGAELVLPAAQRRRALESLVDIIA